MWLYQLCSGPVKLQVMGKKKKNIKELKQKFPHSPWLLTVTDGSWPGCALWLINVFLIHLVCMFIGFRDNTLCCLEI